MAEYESNGRMWPHIHTRIVAALVIYQLTMIGYFGVKKFHYAPFLIPLPVLTLIFSYICHTRFYAGFNHVPLQAAAAAHQAHPAPNLPALFSTFIPPCLVSPTGEGNNTRDDADEFQDARSKPASRSTSFA